MPRKQFTPFQLNHTYLKPKLWQIIQINCMHFHCLSSLICCHVICHHIISCAVGYARFPLSSSSLLFTLSTAVIWFPAGCFPSGLGEQQRMPGEANQAQFTNSVWWLNKNLTGGERSSQPGGWTGTRKGCFCSN